MKVTCKPTSFTLAVPAAVLAITLGCAVTSHAAPLRYDFVINELQRVGSSTDTPTLVPIIGSFVFDAEATPVSFSGRNAVTDFNFTISAPTDFFNLDTVTVSGSNLLTVGPQITFQNNFRDPLPRLSTLRFARSADGLTLNLALVQSSEGSFNTIGVDPSRNTLTFSPVVTAVPLPTAGWMLLAGLLGLFGLRRRFAS